jgi:hypothetical protein
MQSAEIFLYSLDDLVLVSHKPPKLLDLPFSSSELLGAAGLEGRLQSAVGLFDVCFRCVGRHTGREHRELGNFILLQPEKDRLSRLQVRASEGFGFGVPISQAQSRVVGRIRTYEIYIYIYIYSPQFGLESNFLCPPFTIEKPHFH